MSEDPAPVAHPSLRPPYWMRGGDLDTIVPYIARHRDWSHPTEDLDVEVAPGNAVRLRVTRPAGSPRGTFVGLHGLGGSADSRYLVATARVALARGLVVVRMNLRNCGGSAALANTLYNAGQADDLGAVLDALDPGFPRPFLVAGFSLGGNLALLHAGREGSAARFDRMVAVSPPIELDRCLRRLERPRNRLYEIYFVRKLCRQMQAIERVRPLAGPARPEWRRVKTLRNFDEVYTAPDAGFRSAADYYARSSAAPHLADVRRPAQLLTARNDPMVPHRVVLGHARPGLQVALPARGGHCGFWQAGRPRFWAGGPILDFLQEA